jgi:dienelactone hydrolase
MKLKLSISVLLVLILCACSSQGLKDKNGAALPFQVDAYPVGDKKTAPTVFISHGSNGVQDHYREWAKLIQSWGYNAVLVDHYSVRGIGYHTGEFIPGARGEDRARDLVQASEWASGQSWHSGKMAAIGFGQGGAGIMALNESQDALEYYKIVQKGKKIPFIALVAFYPTCALYRPPLNPSTPIKTFFGGNDILSPMANCYPYNNPLYLSTIYPDATNAFDIKAPFNGGKYKHVYRPDLAAQSQQETKTFLDKYLK